jgi:lysophospholipase L1-like esterase
MSTTVFQDTFSRTSGNPITTGTPDIGTGYTVYTGATAPLISSAGRARTDGTGNFNRVLAETVSALPDHFYSVAAELTYVGSVAANGSIAAVYSHDNGSGINYEFRFNAGGLSFWSSGGSFGSPPPAISYAVGDSFRMTIAITDNGGTACNLDFYFQRLSDGFYLKYDGTWQSAPITCAGEGTFVVANGSMNPIGKGGFRVYGFVGDALDIQVDNFQIVTVAGAAPATQFDFTGPTAATVGAASTAFTLSPNGLVTAATITPSDGGAGGTFTPSSVSWTNETVNKTFTYTPATIGTHTITAAVTSGAPTTVTPSSINVACSILPYIVFVGDSNFWNPSGSATESIPAMVLTSLLNGVKWAGENRGVSGYTIANADADLPNWTGEYDGQRTHNLAIVMIGTNGVGSLGAATSYSQLQGYLSDLRTAQPGWKVLLVTIPRLDSSPSNRAAYNSLILANGVNDGAAWIIDTTGDIDLETDNNFSDGLHYTELGRNRMAAHLAAGIALYLDSLPKTGGTRAALPAGLSSLG